MKVCFLCRHLGLLPPGPRAASTSDEQLVEMLLTPSLTRFQLLCEAYCLLCPELRAELEELKPHPKQTVEEAKHQHILEFVHDAGIFDSGDEADLAAIKGELPPEKHLDFWFENLKLVKMMEEQDEEAATKLNADTLLEEAESFTEQMRLLSLMQPVDVNELVSGPLADHLEKQKGCSVDIKQLLADADSNLKKLQDLIDEMSEDSEASEPPPESLVDDESLTKMKLLHGHLKDMVNTFLLKYDLTLKTVVEENCLPLDPRGELEDLLSSISQKTSSISDFVLHANAVVDRLDSLRSANSNASDISSELKTLINENSDALALNFEISRSRSDSGVYDGFFDDL